MNALKIEEYNPHIATSDKVCGSDMRTANNIVEYNNKKENKTMKASKKQTFLNVKDSKARVAVILSRVSSLDQQDNYSLDAQDDKLQAYCEAKGLEVIGSYKLVESSSRGDRPEFQKVLNFVRKQKQPIAIVCDKVDRLQRSFKFVPLLEEWRKQGKIELHFRSDNAILTKDSSSSELLQYDMLVIFAKYYAECISENVLRSHERMQKEGRIFTEPPIGYKRSENNKKEIVFDEERAFLIRKLFVEYSTGLYSYDQLRDMAKAWGLRNKTKLHKPLGKSQIAQVLANEFYIGIATVKGEKYKHIYPHLISDELFEKCRQVREGRRSAFSKKTKDTAHTLFKGMIRCKNCGCLVTPEPPKKGKYVYLRPNTKKGCNCKQINEEVANKLVEEVLKNMSIPSDVLELYLDKLKQRFDTQQQEESIQQKLKLKELNSIEDSLNELLDMCLKKVITREEYVSKRQELERNSNLLKNQIENYNNNLEEVFISMKHLLEVGSRIYELYCSSGIERKREILKLIFPNFWLDGSNLSYEINKTFEIFLKGLYCLLNWAAVDSNHRPHPYQGCALTT